MQLKTSENEVNSASPRLILAEQLLCQSILSFETISKNSIISLRLPWLICVKKPSCHRDTSEKLDFIFFYRKPLYRFLEMPFCIKQHSTVVKRNEESQALCLKSERLERNMWRAIKATKGFKSFCYFFVKVLVKDRIYERWTSGFINY